jgi:DNA-binding NarL/FixJ family response regulator
MIVRLLGENAYQNKHGRVRNLTSEVRGQQIEWRRSQVLELASQGYNQREICQKLQLDKSAESRGPSKTASPREPAETYP